MISARFEDFCQSLRIFVEQKMRFQDLFLVDAPEAIGNLELGCKGMLDAFHSLYDAARATAAIKFDFYGSPLCSFVLAYRNAKHHNQALGIRSVHRHAMNSERHNYMLVDFPGGVDDEGGSFVDHFASWGDFSQLFDMPRDRSRLRADTKNLVRNRIAADQFEEFSRENGIPAERIFINTIPMIIGAGSEFIPHLKDQIVPGSVEARHFLWHFEKVSTANFGEPQYTELSSASFG